MKNRLFKLVTCGVLVVTLAGCTKTPEAAKTADDQSTNTASQAATTVAQLSKKSASLAEIKQATIQWGIVRTSSEKALSYLKQGSCFKIERAQFEKWNGNSPEKLHAYLGIFDNKLKIVLIDDVSDKNPAANMDYIFVQDYLKGLTKAEEALIDNATDGNLTTFDALKKTTQWKLLADSWVAEKAKTSEIFQAFIIPFSDLKSQFEGTSSPESVAFIGLNDNTQADLILYGLKPAAIQTSGTLSLKSATGIPVIDFAHPVPPYESVDDPNLGLIP